MVEQGAKHLLLTGRSGAKGKEEKIRQLTQAGASVKVVKADVSSANDVAKMFTEAKSTMPPVRGIVHAAGVLDDGMLLGQSWARFEKVMNPKVKGAWNLHTLTEELSLDFFVLFSSETSLLGSAGQANYAAANAFLDGLAHYRLALGLPALSINWSSWAEAGMAAQVSARQQARWKAQGLNLIPPKVGLQLFSKMLGTGGQVGVLPIDWPLFLNANPHQALLSELDHATNENKLEDSFLRRLKEAPINKRLTLLTAHLQSEVAQVLGARQLPELTQGFFDMGMDSLITVELRNRLQATLGVSVPTTLGFEYPTIEKLADYLLEQLFPSKPSQKEESSESQRDTVIREEIEQLSTEDLLAQLTSELADY